MKDDASNRAKEIRNALSLHKTGCKGSDGNCRRPSLELVQQTMAMLHLDEKNTKLKHEKYQQELRASLFRQWKDLCHHNRKLDIAVEKNTDSDLWKKLAKYIQEEKQKAASSNVADLALASHLATLHDEILAWFTDQYDERENELPWH